jgi:hypothetical protein
MFGTWDVGRGSEVWDHIIRITFIRMNFHKNITNSENKKSFLKEIYSFKANSYFAVWIFIIDTDQAQIYSAGKKIGVTLLEVLILRTKAFVRNDSVLLYVLPLSRVQNGLYWNF